MRIKFVTTAEIKAALEAYPGWKFHTKYWHGLYYTQPIPEIWINKEENLFEVVQTLFHEMGHWLMDLAGLDRFNLHYEILTHFFNLTELPKDKRRSMSAYYSEIKKPRLQARGHTLVLSLCYFPPTWASVLPNYKFIEATLSPMFFTITDYNNVLTSAYNCGFFFCPLFMLIHCSLFFDLFG